MYITSYSSSFSATTVVGGNSSDNGYVCAFFIRPKTTVALSLVVATLRWNDGQARSQAVTLALTAMGNYASTVFPLLQSTYTDVTLEAVLVGSAQFDIGFGILSA